jgi:PKD repeat protein
MLIRQGINDSIPIKMAISINPYYYTFPCDSLNEIQFQYPCGIYNDINNIWYTTDIYMGASCSEHAKGYYSENYTVLIGTADTLPVPGPSPYWACIDSQGVSRYERAVNFYNFSQQNAIERGTILQWYYAEVPDVGHNGYAMINTKANPEDTVTICEHYLFDMPYHVPQKFPPTADFSYSINDTTRCVEFNANCECWWQIQPTSYYWDFSNGISDTGMTVGVDFPENGQYSVQLIASNIYGSDTIVKTVEVDNLPVADFTVSDTVLILPDSTVIFTFSGSNADSILWDFGDGNFSNEVNPTHNYQDTGYFSVIIWVYNENSCADSTSMLIEVINYNAIYALKEDGKAISIFPNPTTGQITISTGNEAIESIEIYDYLGRKKDEIIVNHRESLYIYNTKNMRGLYLFRIKTSENVYTERVWYRQ